MAHILIVEDEDAIRRVLVKILSEENTSYSVDEGKWYSCTRKNQVK